MAAGSTIGDVFQNALPTYLGGAPVTAHQEALQKQAAATQISAVAASPGAQVNVGLTEDSTMVNGKTYTFVFTTDGTPVAVDTLISALTDSFLSVQSVSATIIGNGASITFTYEGDGTDMVGDYANAITAAVLSETSGTGPILTYVSGTNNSQTVAQVIAPTVVKQVAASNADQTQLAAQANAAAKASDTAQLLGFGTLAIIAVAVGLFIFLKAQPKVSVG